MVIRSFSQELTGNIGACVLHHSVIQNFSQEMLTNKVNFSCAVYKNRQPITNSVAPVEQRERLLALHHETGTSVTGPFAQRISLSPGKTQLRHNNTSSKLAR